MSLYVHFFQKQVCVRILYKHNKSSGSPCLVYFYWREEAARYSIAEREEADRYSIAERGVKPPA